MSTIRQYNNSRNPEVDSGLKEPLGPPKEEMKALRHELSLRLELLRHNTGLKELIAKPEQGNMTEKLEKAIDQLDAILAEPLITT